jgi:hypothetical protein
MRTSAEVINRLCDMKRLRENVLVSGVVQWYREI